MESNETERPWGSREFWQARFETGDTPWDLGEASPTLAAQVDELLSANELPPRCRVLVPGCGLGHDVIAMAARGFEVEALDWSEDAVARVARNAAAHALEITPTHGDFFTLELAPVQLFIEYTFFCAIDPSRRADYARRAASLLASGDYLVGAFFVHAREAGLPLREGTSGPPFGATEEEIRGLFGADFHIRRLAPSLEAPASRRHFEWAGVFERR